MTPLTRTGWRLGVLLACGGLLLGLAVVEGALRAFGSPFTTRPPSEVATGRFDDELGWSYIPDQSVTRVVGRERREVQFHFDRWGSRVEGPDVDRDPTRPSVLFVGCSFTLGHGVTAEESAPGQLGRVASLPFQVANFAVQGFGTDQTLLMLERQLRVFNVRAVVYGFICDHLRRNANDDRRLLYPTVPFVGTKPTFDLEGGRLRQTTRPRRYADMVDLRVLDLARLAAQRAAPWPTPDLTRALLAEMRRVTAERHVPLIVVDWRMRPDEARCPPGMLDGLDLDLIHTLDGAPPGWARWEIPDDGHPDAANHRRVAGLVLDRLKTLGLAGPRLALPADTVTPAGVDGRAAPTPP